MIIVNKKNIVLALTVTIATFTPPDCPKAEWLRDFIGIDLSTYAHAESTEPSIQAYVTKGTLISADPNVNKFIPNGEGKNDIVGLLYFGRDESGNAQQWYLLGSDDGATGSKENTVIFSVDALKTGVIFREYLSSYPKWYNADTDGAYLDFSMKSGTEVYYSHYGISGIRKTLQSMAADAQYFNKAEQKLLQSTKIKTYDTKNNNTAGYYSSYITEDKLYLAGATAYKDSSIYIGSAGDRTGKGIKLYFGTYLRGASEGGTNRWFWLREPNEGTYQTVYIGAPAIKEVSLFNSRANSSACATGGDVRPAANLDLQDVLFASAAQAVTSGMTENGGTITTSGTSQAAMTLRMDGSKEDVTSAQLGGTIGGAELSDNKIKLTKGSTVKPVSLIIQGKDNGSDWYYAKAITEDTILTAESITDHADADLSKCKIWLEATGDDGLLYAVDATRHVHVYPTDKATPTQLMGKDEISHWWKCIDDECPDTENKGKMNMAGELGTTDPHHFVKTKEDVTASFKDNPDFLKDGTGDVTYRANEAGECERVTKYYVYCWDCEYKTSETFDYVEVVRHKYTEEHNGYTILTDEHYKKCLNCGLKSDEGKHEYDDDNDAECNKCGYLRGHKHQPLERKEEVKPTCTEDGNIEYHYCINGDFVSKDPIGMVPLTIAQTILKATGHKAASYQYDEAKHWKICENINDDVTCGTVFAEGEHVFSGNKCIVCGYTKSSGNGDDDSTRNTDRYKHDDPSGGGSGGGGGTSTTTNDGRTPGTAIDGNSGGSSGGGGNGSGWEHDGHGWKYKLPTGQYAAGTSETGPDGNTIAHALFVKIDGAIWAFGADEYLIVGWVQDAEGKWWYIDIDRGLLLGWIYDTSDDNWYYCSESNGMLTGWFYDTEASYWYYLDPESGAMHTGWQTIDGKQYYLAPEPPHTTYSFNGLSAQWYYDNPFGHRPYGSLYVSTTTPDNRQVDANGAAM